jgi:hypothetical protein
VSSIGMAHSSQRDFRVVLLLLPVRSFLFLSH